MDGHIHVALGSHRDDSLQEVREIVPQVFLGECLILRNDTFQFLSGIACVPSREGQITVGLQGIDLVHLLLIVNQRSRAVREFVIQLCSGPVEDRHKIVADALDSCLGHSADILAVVLNVPVSGGLAQFDVLVYGDALDDLEMESCVLGQLLQPCDGLSAPDLPHRNVIDSGHDGVHAGNLPDLLQGYLVVLSVPAER